MSSSSSDKGSSETPSEGSTRLESKKYNFLVDGTMPVLNFELTSGGRKAPAGMSEINQVEHQSLTIELYAPISGEIFEAKTPKGRIEVDNDGTLTYFSQKSESVTFSLFLGRNLTVSMSKKTGEVIVKTTSKIVSIEDNRQSIERRESDEEVLQPFSDEIRLRLE